MDEIHLTARSLHGEETEILAHTSECVQTLKDKIALWQRTATDNVILLLKGRYLDEDLTLQAVGVRDGACILVAIKRPPKPASKESDPMQSRPLLANSKSVVPPSAPKPPIPRGLISSQVRPAPPPAERPAGIRPPSLTADVAALAEMGFDSGVAYSALKNAGGDLEDAVDILSGDISIPLVLRIARRKVKEDPGVLNLYLRKLLLVPQIKEMECSQPGALLGLITMGNEVPLRPINPTAVEEIKRMGFTEAQALEALEATNGEEDLALEILLK